MPKDASEEYDRKHKTDDNRDVVERQIEFGDETHTEFPRQLRLTRREPRSPA